jgi:hypothetical protein
MMIVLSQANNHYDRGIALFPVPVELNNSFEIKELCNYSRGCTKKNNNKQLRRPRGKELQITGKLFVIIFLFL